MRNFFKNRTILHPDRNEFYPSLILMGVSTYYVGSPPGYAEILFCVALVIGGFFCALNAILDGPQMHIVERGFALVWFSLTLCWTPFVLYLAFTATGNSCTRW